MPQGEGHWYCELEVSKLGKCKPRSSLHDKMYHDVSGLLIFAYDTAGLDC